MEQPHQQQQQNHTDQKHRKKMRKLRDTIVAQLTALNPSKPITHDVVSLIQQRLQHMFPSLHTPTHYPYSSMIRRAIVELNEEGGSSEEEISGFIKREYEGLPWGHVSLLTHHLRRLCENGEVLVTCNRRYMIMVEETQSIEEDPEGAVDKYNGLKGEQIEVFDEESEEEEEPTEAHGRKVKAFEEQRKGGRRIESRARGRRIEVMEKGAKEEQIEVVENRNVSGGGDSLRVPLGVSTMPTGEQEKESLKAELQQRQQRQSHCGGRKLIIVCGLMAQQKPKEKICGEEKASKSHPAKISEVLELPIEPLEQQQIKLSSIRGPSELEVTTLEELIQNHQKVAPKSLRKGMETFPVMPTNSQELQEEQPLELQKSEQLQELGIRTVGASISGGQEAVRSQPMAKKASIKLPLVQLEVEKQAEPPELCCKLNTHSSIVSMKNLEHELEQHHKLQNPENSPQHNLSKTENTATTLLYVHMNSEPEIPEPGVSPDLKLSLEAGKKLPQAQQEQQTQGQQKQKPLRLRIRGPSKPISATATTMAASLLFQHQHEQQQAPQHQGQQTPPIPKPQTYVNTNIHEQQLPKCRGPGRPPKLKPDAKPDVAVLLPSDCQHHNVQQQQSQGQGRRESSGLKSDVNTIIGVSEHQHCEGSTATTLEVLLHKQHQGQEKKPQSRGRGRPPKLKSDSDTVNEDLLTSQNKQQ